MLNIFKISKLLLLFTTLAVLMGCNQRYTVTFDSNGGTAIDSVTVNKGDLVSEPTYPTKEGYTFDGWYDGNEKWVFIDDKVMNDIILVAKWNLNEYLITFNSDGGSDVPAVNVKRGDTIVEPVPPIKEGYTFDGWYKEDNIWDFENKVYSDLTLISKWSLNTYTITIDTDGGMPIEPLSFKYGEEISIDTPKKVGFDFVCRNCGREFSQDEVKSICDVKSITC